MQNKEKRQMQNVRFLSVGELLDFLQGEQLEMTDMLRELVFECVPGVEERLSFNVPFFRRYGALCFIWPGAVSWGSTVWEGVEFGFNNGHLLADEDNYLDKGNRKMVFTKRFFNVHELRANTDKLRSLVLEAVEINELLHMEKRKSNRIRRILKD
ncbi:MAG TPA: DUF1801 domain-containing protein [Saprospiraceae bacterium]|nr:DUF1801 domain-containing protein [Saprospiraceae bacterium]